jgi:hypothetical protein
MKFSRVYSFLLTIECDIGLLDTTKQREACRRIPWAKEAIGMVFSLVLGVGGRKSPKRKLQTAQALSFVYVSSLLEFRALQPHLLRGCSCYTFLTKCCLWG